MQRLSYFFLILCMYGLSSELHAGKRTAKLPPAGIMGWLSRQVEKHPLIAIGISIGLFAYASSSYYNHYEQLNSALHKACASGEVDKIVDLVSQGADINSFMKSFSELSDEFCLSKEAVFFCIECTPLILATRNNQLAVVKELLKLGADATKEDKSGRTAYYLAIVKQHKEIAEFLAAQGYQEFDYRTQKMIKAFDAGYKALYGKYPYDSV